MSRETTVKSSQRAGFNNQQGKKNEDCRIYGAKARDVPFPLVVEKDTASAGGTESDDTDVIVHEEVL
jgi:hypothetical protein